MSDGPQDGPYAIASDPKVYEERRSGQLRLGAAKNVSAKLRLAAVEEASAAALL